MTAAFFAASASTFAIAKLDIVEFLLTPLVRTFLICERYYLLLILFVVCIILVGRYLAHWKARQRCSWKRWEEKRQLVLKFRYLSPRLVPRGRPEDQKITIYRYHRGETGDTDSKARSQTRNKTRNDPEPKWNLLLDSPRRRLVFSVQLDSGFWTNRSENTRLLLLLLPRNFFIPQIRVLLSNTEIWEIRFRDISKRRLLRAVD